MCVMKSNCQYSFSGPKAIQELVVKIEVKNRGKNGNEIFLFLSGFFGNRINQMASPGHFMWKFRYLEGTWLEKVFFCKDGSPAADLVR